MRCTLPPASPARTTSTSPSASTSGPASAVSWSSSSLFRRRRQGDKKMVKRSVYLCEVEVSLRRGAIKFANRASPIHQDSKIEFPIFPISGEEKDKKKFSHQERSLGLDPPPPFHLVEPRAGELPQIGKSAFLCFGFNSPRSLFN